MLVYVESHRRVAARRVLRLRTLRFCFIYSLRLCGEIVFARKRTRSGFALGKVEIMQKRIFYPHSVDLVQLRLLANLPAHKRLRVMLDARELAVGMMRGRLRKEFPNLTSRQLNLKLLEEISHANR